MIRRSLLAGLAVLLLLPSATPAAADAAADLAAAQARAQTIDSVRLQLGSQLATALQTQDQIAQSLRDNAAQQLKLRGDMADTDQRITSLGAEIDGLDSDITSTNARIDNEKAQIRSLARAIYAQPTSMLLLVVESTSLGDMLSRVNDLRSAGTHADALKDQLKVDLARLDKDRTRIDAARVEQLALRDTQAINLVKLQALAAAQVKAQADLTAHIDATKAELSKINNQSAVLAQQIADLLLQQQVQLIAAAEQAVWDQVQTIQPVGLPSSLSPGHSTKFRFFWPMPGSVETQPFGPSSLPFEPPYQQYPHFHTGIDMSSAAGTSVYAADDGVVILAGASAVNGVLVGYGNYVIIAHPGGLSTLYGHLLKVGVKVGDRVTQAQLVGFEGSTGNSTGPHLHFELRQGNTPVDPAPFLPPGPPSDYRA